MGVKQFVNLIRNCLKKKTNTLPPTRSVSIGGTLLNGASAELTFMDAEGPLFCLAPTNEHPYPIFSDSFDSINNDLAGTGANVTSTLMVADGKCTAAAVPGSHGLSGWYNCNSIANNVVISVEATGESPQIRLRESDNGNMLIVWYDKTGSLRIDDLSNGILTNRKKAQIPDHDSSIGYQIVVKLFNNHLSVSMFRDNLLINALDYTGLAISGMRGTLNSLGSSTTAEFRNFKSRKITRFINMVCLGDSNTHKARNQPAIDPGTGHLYTSLLASRFVMDGFAVSNAGLGGDRTIDIAARLDADLRARWVAGARNIATLMAGVNDFHKGATVEDTLMNMGALINAVLNDGWELWVMTYPPHRPYSASLRHLNNWIKQNADLNGYKVIDIHAAMVRASDNERHPAYCWPNGNQHFPPAGHAVVADMLTSALLQCGAVELDGQQQWKK